jgi:hypothetical protein
MGWRDAPAGGHQGKPEPMRKETLRPASWHDWMVEGDVHDRDT